MSKNFQISHGEAVNYFPTIRQQGSANTKSATEFSTTDSNSVTSANSKQSSAIMQHCFERADRQKRWTISFNFAPGKTPIRCAASSFQGVYVRLEYGYPKDRAVFQGLNDPGQDAKGKDGTTKTLKEHGYTSAENWMADIAEDPELADKAVEKGLLPPARQAKSWFNEGVHEDYEQQLDKDFQSCLDSMKGMSYFEKRRVVREFKQRWAQKLNVDIPRSFNREAKKIEGVFSCIFDKIKPNRDNEFFVGNWQWTGDESRWRRDYEGSDGKIGRKQEAKNSVSAALEDAKKTAIANLEKSISDYSAELETKSQSRFFRFN